MVNNQTTVIGLYLRIMKLREALRLDTNTYRVINTYEDMQKVSSLSTSVFSVLVDLRYIVKIDNDQKDRSNKHYIWDGPDDIPEASVIYILKEVKIRKGNRLSYADKA